MGFGFGTQMVDALIVIGWKSPDDPLNEFVSEAEISAKSSRGIRMVINIICLAR